MICARRILIDGLDNTRDIGGFLTEDGNITLNNVFFRSESLYYMQSEKLSEFEKYGIYSCIDIHGPVHNSGELHPFQKDSRFEYRRIPILSDIIRHTGTEKDNFKEEDWVPVNIRMLETNKQWICEVIKACAETKGGTIIHCRTGKSRTSLICMIIMLLAKVPLPDIIAEFATTEIYMKEKYGKYLENSFHSEGFYKSPAFVMECTISHINNNYGDVVNYLHSCGVDDSAMKKILDKYVCKINCAV